jgi:hypothetical protein
MKAQAVFLLQPSSPYKSMEEQRALKSFIECCAPVVTVYSDPTVWESSIPQAAWQHPAVRDAVIATTLVNETTVVERRRPKYGHDNRALVYVNRCINAVVREKPPTEVMLMVGLLLQFMETLNHNAHIAIMHLMGAVRILDEYKTATAHSEKRNTEQAEFIFNHLEPTLQVAVKFAQVVLQNSLSQPAIDQWTPQAFELKQQLVETMHPGSVDSFRTMMDSRNNLGVAAVKLMEFRVNYGGFHYNSASMATESAGLQDRTSIEVASQTVQSVLGHWARLHRPIHNADDPESCMLQIHHRILLSILRDSTERGGVVIRTQQHDDYDDLLEQTLSLLYNNKAHEQGDLQVELGIIPLLFHLAIASGRCKQTLRKRAVACLRGLLAERREGVWTGGLAGSLAAEIIALEEESPSDGAHDTLKDYHLDLLNDAGAQLAMSAVPKSYFESETAGSGLHLWLTYTINTGPSQASGSSNGECTEQRGQTRKRLPWTKHEIARLPRNINTVVRDYGYQGYFSDAAEAPGGFPIYSG